MVYISQLKRKKTASNLSSDLHELHLSESNSDSTYVSGSQLPSHERKITNNKGGERVDFHCPLKFICFRVSAFRNVATKATRKTPRAEEPN